MNFHDSALLREGLAKKGFAVTNSQNDADIVIFNTCSVRDHAEHKVASDIGRVKEGKKIVLAGCFAGQVKIKKATGGNTGYAGINADYCFSPGEIMSIPDILLEKESKTQNEFAGVLQGVHKSPPFANPDLTGDNYRDFAIIEDYFYNKDITEECETIKIMEGCNNYCTYCIVPYVRGEERSVPFDIIYKTAEIYAEKGVKEILLLGQNVNSYSSPEDGKKDFKFLLNSISKIEGIEKIRFISPHPKDLNDDLIETICKNDKISKAIHLPVQSGSDKILSLMERNYTSGEYINIVEKIRKILPDAVFSTDIIVGFPGETESDFNSTLELLEKIGFDFIFGFKYSPRPFTKAFKIKDDVSVEQKKERLSRLFSKQAAVFKSNIENLVGKEISASIRINSIETAAHDDIDGADSGYIKAVAPNDRTVYIKKEFVQAHKKNTGSFNKVRVKIIKAEGNKLYGEVIK